ncbi:MAG: type II toxin-antitoxin system PemK/MazF family toxin [Gemmatimonadota bacterium]
MGERASTGQPRPLRGEIWEFDLRPRRGREQKGIRPCLIVSTDALNRSAFGTAILCPLTTTERSTFAWRVCLEPSDLRVAAKRWKPRRSWVQTDQLVTVDARERARQRLARVVNDARIAEVDDSLRLMLDL